MRFVRALLLASLACGWAPRAHAQEFDASLLEDTSLDRTYLLELSGTVLREGFSGRRASLRLSKAPPGSGHPYLVLIEGFPQQQTRNSFFWNSEEASMEVQANRITSRVPSASRGRSDIHFFYLSPALLELPSFTHREQEDRRQALKEAKPTKVFAQAGELKLAINALTVSGTIWIKGYDSTQKSYVQYAASFSGRREPRVEQTQQVQ